MFKTLMNRFEQGYRTSAYPKAKIELPSRYRGRPAIDAQAPADLYEDLA